MHPGFYSVLFIALSGYGVWLQRSYMSVYSQEFELQQRSNRANSPFALAKNLDIKEYRSGTYTNHFSSNEARFLNNGQVSAIGKVHYATINSDGSHQMDVRSSRLLGTMKPVPEGKSFLDTNNGMSVVSFPQEVTAVSGTDHLRGENVFFYPDTKIVESKAPVSWKGVNRNFGGVGFQYSMVSGEFSVGGPVSGTFLPTKEDFSSFGKRK